MERERSRERLKIKNSQSKLNTSQNDNSINDNSYIKGKNMFQLNNSNSSIREVPEFVARLNKSPSGSSIKNLRGFGIGGGI
jgi:hypothetical protein